MTGPYTALVYLGSNRHSRGAADLRLEFEDMYYADGKGEATYEQGGMRFHSLSEPAKLAGRFYRDGASATMRGTTNLAAFYVGALLEAGESASIVIRGFHGGEPTDANSIYVERDEAGRLLSSLGSRVGSLRHFVGA